MIDKNCINYDPECQACVEGDCEECPLDEGSEYKKTENARIRCNGCKHLNLNNNPDIGYEVCSGEYCDYKYKPILTIKQSLSLHFGLPGLNEMINVARANKYVSVKQKKKKYTKLVEKELIAQHCIPDEPLTSINVNCIWTESGHARDPDNIRVGIKYVLDAMVNTGVLKDDSMKYVKFLGDTFQKGNKRMIEIKWEE